jgi:DNA-binding transcriptional LysR family regulator
MNLKQIRYVLAICQERNFTRAAAKCRVRQPSLTVAIQRLEHELGGALFVRSNPVELSVLGHKLQPLFAQLSALIDEVRSVAAGRALSVAGVERESRVRVEQ